MNQPPVNQPPMNQPPMNQPPTSQPVPVPEPPHDPAAQDGLVEVDIAGVLGRAVTCVAALAVLGTVGGLVWGLLAPGVTGVVAAPGRSGELGVDSTHRFDAIAVFACVAAVIGVVGTLAVWAVRAVRGPIGVLTTVVGSMIGSAAGVWLGGLVAEARHPGPAGSTVGQYFTTAPGLRLPGAALDLSGLFGFDVSLSLSWSVVVVAPVASLLTLVVLVLASRADLDVPVDERRQRASRDTTAEHLTAADAESRTRR